MFLLRRAGEKWKSPGILLLVSMDDNREWQKWLATVLQSFACQAGTLHRTDESGERLRLVAQVGVPDVLWDKIALIPFGKGIAGVAAATRRPVELCNLQQDLGGVAEPAARQTGVSGSLAVPVLSLGGERVLGTLGIGKSVPYSFSVEEQARLSELAMEAARQWE